MKLDNPENIQMSIKEAKNLLTITEQDTIRLADLREKIEAEIKGLLISKDNAQKELDMVSGNLDILRKELSNEKLAKEEISKQNKEQLAILEDTKNKIKEKEKSLDERESIVKNLEYINLRANDNVEERSIAITQREQAIKEKEKIIKEFVNKLWV